MSVAQTPIPESQILHQEQQRNDGVGALPLLAYHQKGSTSNRFETAFWGFQTACFGCQNGVGGLKLQVGV